MPKNILAVLFILTQTLSVFSQETGLKFEEKYPVKFVSLVNDIFEFTNSQAVKYNTFDRNIYLLDKRSFQIAVFDTLLTLIKSSKKLMQGPISSLPRPGAVTFDNTGRLIFADFPKGKIQMLDSDFNIISEFGDLFLYDYLLADMNTNSKNHIYFHFPGDRFLFRIYDQKGKEIDRLGKLNRKNPIPDNSNSVFFTIDEDDNLYCAYRHYSKLVKYDKHNNILFSKNVNLRDLYYRLPEKYKISQEIIKSTVKGFKFISVDNMNIYTGILEESNIVFVLDKNTGIPVKIFHLKANGRFDNFEFRTKNYFYGVDEHNKLLVKFKK